MLFPHLIISHIYIYIHNFIYAHDTLSLSLSLSLFLSLSLALALSLSFSLFLFTCICLFWKVSINLRTRICSYLYTAHIFLIGERAIAFPRDSTGIRSRSTRTMWAPSHVCWFMNPMNIIVLSIHHNVNHSYWSFEPQTCWSYYDWLS